MLKEVNLNSPVGVDHLANPYDLTVNPIPFEYVSIRVEDFAFAYLAAMIPASFVDPAVSVGELPVYIALLVFIQIAFVYPLIKADSEGNLALLLPDQMSL